MKIQFACLSATVLLVGCSSLSKPETITRIIEVEAPQPTQSVRSAGFSSNADPKQAAIVCETADMRALLSHWNKPRDAAHASTIAALRILYKAATRFGILPESTAQLSKPFPA